MRKQSAAAFDYTAMATRSAEGILLVAGVVFVASLLGIFTRPMGLLASFWPANPILLGLMIRKPRLSTPAGWTSACFAYLAADMITGANIWTTLWLTGANLAGVASGFFLFQQLPRGDQRLRRPLSIIYMFGICVIATVCSATVGSSVTKILYDRELLTGFAFWFTGDLVNLIIVLPVALTIPSPGRLQAAIMSVLHKPAFIINDWLPAIAFILSLAGSGLVGGVGAFAYSVPALLWCAVRYELFYVACCSFLYCAVQTVLVTSGLYSSFVEGDALNSIMSVRLAIVLIALGPLSVASINAARTELISRLERAVRYDFLTNSLSRREFIEQATATLAERSLSGKGTAIILMDIDHFKAINDQYGHSAGDRVLVAFTSRLSAILGKSDLMGRLGGEEFGFVLSVDNNAQAEMVADEIRKAVEELRVGHLDGSDICVTVSGGLVFTRSPTTLNINLLLTKADALLYEAKNNGRNRIVSSTA
ncbi:GGDEF domain-containing protein [Phyllobacterium sp. YR531]|uniref:GGDEF domain-containing protein n=1 Tax=Phyllobacterium sp. YR531 TaxID=1144343 RepID=UPI00026F9068|nr:GGDEF domain-containing protein [Phyllobacterium sp. YR531]EJM99234.1 diguanylate cyclase (GGDEF) domain-containing protein [Phyllobacterium sp. YR531]